MRVLNRLVEDSNAMNGVARRALALMHFDRVEEAIEAGDPDLLEERGEEACVRGCYRCLLSYFNQPDHEAIDRASPEALQLLIDLARGHLVPAAQATQSGTEDGWSGSFAQHGTPAPDKRHSLGTKEGLEVILG